MKKLLLASALVASCLTSFAQTPGVPNGDFENWSTGDCGEKPNQYVTAAESFKADAGFCPTSSGVSKSTNKYSGTYALQLSAINVGQNTSNAVAFGTSFDDGIGVAFTGRPTKLVGYTKFTKGGSDELLIGIEVDDANGDELVYNELAISTTQSGYTKFEITLTYDESNTNAPALLIIGFTLGDQDNGASSNSIALIDALSFEYAPTTGTVNYSAKSPINVFAANKNINFSENVSDVHVTDMVGTSKMQEAASTKTVNGASLNSGLYIVTYNYNGNYFSKKVVIE